MSMDVGAFQVLLAKMRDDFLDELPERCDRLDELILTLEKSADDRETFNELYRSVHSLKGSGGTHGLSIVTTLCHQLENLITETDVKNGFGDAFANRALAYVDLLRRVEQLGGSGQPDYSAIEADLETLRQLGQQSRRIGLIAESSALMAGFHQKALDGLKLQLMVEKNGLTALERLLHEHFDFVIVGRELDELNGIALMAALRASHMRNQNIPAILVSSRAGAIPDHVNFSAILFRDSKLAGNLADAVKVILSS